MVWADCSENITDSSGGKDDLSKYYLNVLYGRIRESEITNSKLRNFHGMGGNFDLLFQTFQFITFFENERTLNNIVHNISSSLRPGGKFVLTTLNGNKVFDSLRYDRVFNSPSMSWKITKKI